MIFYTYDDSAVGSSVVSMEVDKKAFMNVIKDTQFSTKSAKPLKFGQDNGFFRLLEGESSSFTFATATGTADCSCQCVKESPTTTPFTVHPTVTTPVVTTRTTRPSVPTYTFGTTQRPTPTPRFITDVTTPRTSTSGPTYLPPTTLGTASSKKN